MKRLPLRPTILPLLILGFLVECQTSTRAQPEPSLIEYLRGRPSPDTLPVAQRPEIWEAVLRFYRGRRGPTEADISAMIAQREHVDLGSVKQGLAPVVLLQGRRADLSGIAPIRYDTLWLASIRNAHLVASICPETHPDLCADTVLTTYLLLGDPIVLGSDSVRVDVVEVAMNPTICHKRDVLVDALDLSLYLGKRLGDWVVKTSRPFSHATSSCSLIRKRR